MADDATSQKNSDGKTQYSSLNNAQILSFELNSQDSNAPTATGVNLTATYTQANLPQQFKNDGMTGDTFWLYSGADLLNLNVSITKNWANAGSINGRSVDFHERFHDFVAQNNPGDDGIRDITVVDKKKPYLILISSNAVDNIDVYNANFQETFWFTYSNDGSIVDITKFNQANAAQNNNQIFYFLSASLSSNNGGGSNRREYVQTKDAKTVVISKNPINDPSTGFTAPASTMGLTSVSGTNVPDGLVYTNTDPSGYQSHDGEDSNPYYYALQGGVTFADFTSNKPTLYLGAVPISNSNIPWWAHSNWWWHGNHNKNSDFLSFVTYSIFNNKKVNETINYVDQTGQTVAPSHTANPITFITVKAWDGTTTYYKFGSQEDPTLDNAGKPDSSWIQANNAKFGAIDNPKVKGYKVISTTAPGSDLNSVAIQTVNSTSDDLKFTVTYTLNQEAANVTYIDDKTGKTLSAKDLTGDYDSTDPYRTGDTIADYEKQGYQLVSDNYPTHGVVYNQDGTVQSFEVHLTHGTTPVGPNNPQTPGEPINPDNPDGPKWPEGTDKNSVTQTVIRTVNYLDKQTGKVVAKQVTEQVTYNRTAIVDKVTGQIIGYSTTGGDTVDQTDGDKAWTAVDNKSDWDSVTSPDLSSKGYLAPDLATVAQQTVTPGDKDVTVNVYYDHDVVPVNPTHPQTPGTPINPDNPDGPKWPEGTDKSAVTQTVIRTVNYLDKQTGKVVAKQVTEQVTYNRTAIVDKVTGQIIGYSTTGGDTVDQTDGDKAWTAVDNKSDWDSVTSPDLSSKGYLAPDLATVAQQTVTPGDKDVTVNVYYDHDVVPVNPTHPQTPGTPINPDDPDSPKWPAGTDKNSLTTDVHQTIHYQYGDGSQAAPDKTDSTTFDHQVEIDKVTGEIVKDDGWTAENGKTSFDSKNSPVIPGYTASKPASDPVDGLTQDSKDNVQTIIYTSNQEAANVTYIDDKTGKTLSAKHLTGDYGSTDPYRTGDTIADYEKQGYQLVSDNYPTHGVVYNQDGTVQSFEVHLTHGTTPVGTNNPQTPGTPINPDDPDSPKWPAGTDKNSLTTDVHQTIHYQYGDGSQAAPDKTDSTTFDHQVEIDKVTGEIVKDDGWTAENGKTSFDSKNSPVIPGYTASKPASDPVDGLTQDSKDNVQTIIYTSNQEAANVTYIDDKTGKTLSAKHLTGDYGSTDPYRTGDTIADYEKQGYQLVSDNYPTHGVVYNQDGTVQSFEVHLTHGTTPVGPNNPQTPGEPINPDNPDGPKWPEGTDKNSVTQTVIRTVNYLDKQTGKVVAKQVTEQVTYNRTAIVDKVTGQIIGYSTTGGDTVDQTDGDKAWTAVDNKSDWDSVTSPDLSSKGYLAPDLATVAQQTVTPGDKDVTVNVYYDHDVVPVNPTNPQRPGEPINPDNPDGPKWPEGTDKSSVTQTVIRTVNSPELPQTGENNSQSQTMSFIGILLAMFGSLFGFLGIKKRRND